MNARQLREWILLQWLLAANEWEYLSEFVGNETESLYTGSTTDKITPIP